LLGLYGPNQAADCLVTRINDAGNTEMIAIKRGDVGLWAMPGGMVDKKETARHAAIREFKEEAIDKSNISADVMTKLESLLQNSGSAAWVGYVDDPRNTDISWMEVSVKSSLHFQHVTNTDYHFRTDHVLPFSH
jgi:ADP-ribose pyrophosphatase